jgi:PAS domain S-box-containing protein
MTPYPSSSLPSIPWHRRLESRVLFWVTLVSGASLIALLLGASRIVTLSSLERSTGDVLAAREAFDHLLDRQAAFAAAQTRLITELPVFRAHLTGSRVAAGRASVNEMAAEYRHELKAEFCVVTDAKGTWLARPGWPVGVAPPGALVAGIDAARSGRPSSDMLTLPDGLFLVVFEPALFTKGDVLGTMTAGYPLDSAMARLATDAHTDVTFICDGARVCGSSLRVRERTDLASVLATDRARLGAVGAKPARLGIGAAEFVGGMYPIGASSAGLILLQPWQPTQQMIDAMQARLLWIGVLTFLAALGGSLVFSRRITRPLRELVNVANDIAAGDWVRRVPVGGPAEAKLMAGAFNHMTATLSHWHAEATRRSDELQDSYERFRAVTEPANDAIVSVDSRGRIVCWNQQAETVFGYTAGEAIGQSFAMLMPDLTGRRQAEAALRQREEHLRQSQKMEAVGRLAGGGRLTIDTRASGRDVLLVVGDTRCGMTEEVRARIFEPFFMTKGAGEGTGLGLSTVYGILQQGGGTIAVESEPGRGATFTISLPAAGGVRVPAAPAPAPALREATGGGSEMILLVEDNDLVRALAREVLGRDGYRVIEARDGDEGLRLGTEHLAALDLVVTDLVMPGLGGRELARRLTALRPDLRIIFTSGYTDDAIVRQGALVPGSTFLQKPFTPDTLGRLVREVLDARQLRNGKLSNGKLSN